MKQGQGMRGGSKMTKTPWFGNAAICSLFFEGVLRLTTAESFDIFEDLFGRGPKIHRAQARRSKGTDALREKRDQARDGGGGVWGDYKLCYN